MYFTTHEFRCRCGKCGLDGSQMDKLFLDRAIPVRAKCDFAWDVNSGVRCEEWNKKSFGKVDSLHLVRRGACAMDVAITDGTKRRILVDSALDAGFSIGIARLFIHMDDRTRVHGEPQIVFTY